MTGLRLNLLAMILVFALIFFQYRLWFDSSGIRDMVQLKKTLAMQAEENEKLKKRNEALLFQIRRLQNSQDAPESRARNELGMVKSGETFYQIVK
jgi:cell division protein FtsB